MSDTEAATFSEASEEVALRAAVESIEAGGAATFAESLLGELSGEAIWRSETILERLRKLPQAERLLPHVATALGDQQNVERRNAARSILASLGDPTSVSCEAAMASLAELLLHSDEADTRLLAAATLGEAGNARARADLERALEDSDPNVASAAAESLGLLGDHRAVPALIRAAGGNDFWVRAAAVLALGRLGDSRGLPALSPALADPLLAPAAAEAIGQIGDPSGVEMLRPLFAQEGEARMAAFSGVARIYGTHSGVEVPAWLRTSVAEAQEPMLARLRDDHDTSAARLLGIAGTVEAARALIEAAADDDLRPIASVGLGYLPHALRVEVILDALDDAEPATATTLLEVLPALSTLPAIEAVVRRLGNEEPEVRAAAADALGRSDPAPVLTALLSALDHPGLRLGAVLALGRLGSERCGPLLGLVDDPSAEIRIAAVAGLARCGAGELSVLARRLQEEPEVRVREALLAAVGEIGGDDVVPVLSRALQDPHPALRYAAARALGRTRSARAFDALLSCLKDEAPEVRIAALHALGELGDIRASAVVGNHLDESSREVRRTAARALDRVAGRLAAQPLIRSLEDPDREVRLIAIDTLGRIGGPQAEAALAKRADVEPDPVVRAAASRGVLDIRDRTASRK